MIHNNKQHRWQTLIEKDFVVADDGISIVVFAGKHSTQDEEVAQLYCYAVSVIGPDGVSYAKWFRIEETKKDIKLAVQGVPRTITIPDEMVATETLHNDGNIKSNHLPRNVS